MAVSAQQKVKVDLLRASVRLQDPLVELDPVYQFTDQELLDIMMLTTPTHNILYTIDTLPANELYFSIQLAKKEVYYRLATSTAPFYPLSAEGASLEKNVRFDHYMALIKQCSADYSGALKQLTDGDGIVSTYETKLLGHYYTLRNYNSANTPSVELTVGNITRNSVELDWTKYSLVGGLFASYQVYVSTETLVDEYAFYRIKPNSNPNFLCLDIHRTKWRVENLNPDTNYFALVVSYDRNSLYGYSEKTFHTLT